MKIYVVGTGGIGGYFGGLLAKAGNDVTFIARGANFDAIKEEGLTVKGVVGNFVIKPVNVISNISEITEPELVLFCVKTYDTAKTAKQLASVVNNSTIVITFQNGVENDLEIKKFVKNALVFPGVAYVISTQTKPGVIEQTGGLRKLIFGDRQNRKSLDLEKIKDLMVSSGIDASLSENITRDLWKKFVFICAFSGTTAYYQCPIGEILSDPERRTCYEKCLEEAIKVGRAEGVNLPPDIFENLMTTSNNTAPGSKSSLLIDIEKNRQTEMETLNGALVRLAQKHKIDVPVNKLIYMRIRNIK